MGGACEVTVDDGRKPLHVGPEHLGHGLLLGFAQLRKLLGDVGYRAVVLTNLHAVDWAIDAGGGGDVTGLAQRAGDPALRPLRCRRPRTTQAPRHRTGSRRCADGQSCGPPLRRRSHEAAASRRTPDRRSCGPASRGRSRSTGTAWPVVRVRLAATARREPTRPHPCRSTRRGGVAPRRPTDPGAHRSARR